MEHLSTIANQIVTIVKNHFTNKGISTNLDYSSYAGTGTDIYSIKIKGSYNHLKSLEFEINFSKHYNNSILITGFEGRCGLEELETILSEIKGAMKTLMK